MSLALIFAFLLLCISISPINYNAVFAVTWMAGHCQYLGSRCDKHKYDQWDHQSFTIHGLWPNQETEHYYGDFNFGLLKGELLQQMYNYWPPQLIAGGRHHYLWQEQWNTKGHRYSSLMLELAPTNFVMYGIKKRNEALQVDYFTRVINQYKKLNLLKVPQAIYTKDQFAALISIPKESFYFVCLDSGTFKQVRICCKITSSKLELRSCAKTESNCRGQIARLKDWKANQQIVIKENPANEKSDQQRQEQKSKIVPIYRPAQQKKEDEIQIISVETKKDEPQAVKQENLIEEEKQLNIQIQLEHMGSEEEMEEEMKEENKQNQIINKDKVLQVVKAYMIITAILVSMFWIAIIIICIRIFRKKTNQSNSQLKENESTSVNIQNK